MCDTLNFQSSLSNDEIDRSFENVDVFEGIMEGLNDALAYEQGEASVESVVRKRSLPDEDSSGSECYHTALWQNNRSV